MTWTAWTSWTPRGHKMSTLFTQVRQQKHAWTVHIGLYAKTSTSGPGID